MGLFIGFAIVVGGFIFGMYVCYALGAFKAFGDNSEDIYDKKTVEEVALMVYQQQLHVTKINERIDEIPSNLLIKLIPRLGSRYHIKQRVKQLGGKLDKVNL